jgi:ribosomal protein S19
MARSKWKLKNFNSLIWKKIFFNFKQKQNKNILIFSKNIIIADCFCFKKLYIHKGNNFKMLNITKKFIGLRVSSFIFNKKPFNFPLKIEKKKNYVRR